MARSTSADRYPSSGSLNDDFYCSARPINRPLLRLAAVDNMPAIANNNVSLCLCVRRDAIRWIRRQKLQYLRLIIGAWQSESLSFFALGVNGWDGRLSFLLMRDHTQSLLFYLCMCVFEEDFEPQF